MKFEVKVTRDNLQSELVVTSKIRESSERWSSAYIYDFTFYNSGHFGCTYFDGKEEEEIDIVSDNENIKLHCSCIGKPGFYFCKHISATIELALTRSRVKQILFNPETYLDLLKKLTKNEEVKVGDVNIVLKDGAFVIDSGNEKQLPNKIKIREEKYKLEKKLRGFTQITNRIFEEQPIKEPRNANKTLDILASSLKSKNKKGDFDIKFPKENGNNLIKSIVWQAFMYKCEFFSFKRLRNGGIGKTFEKLLQNDILSTPIAGVFLELVRLNFLIKNDTNEGDGVNQLIRFIKNNHNSFNLWTNFFHNDDTIVDNYYGPSVNVNKLIEFKFTDEYVEAGVKISELENGSFLIDPVLKTESGRYLDFNTSFKTNVIVVANQVGYVYKNVWQMKLEEAFDDAVIIPKNDEYLLEGYIKELSKYFFVDFGFDFEQINKPAILQEKRIYLKEFDEYLALVPKVKYEDFDEINIFSDEKLSAVLGKKLLSLSRNEDEEATLRDFLDNDKKLNGVGEDYRYINLDEALSSYWIFDFFKKCKLENIVLFGTDKLNKARINEHDASTSLAIKSNIDWFDLNVEVKFGEQIVDFNKIVSAFQNKEKYIRLGDGSLGVIPEDWLDQFTDILAIGELKKNSIVSSKVHFNLIYELLKKDKKSDLELRDELFGKVLALNDFNSIEEVELPKDFKGSLRPYQQEGLNWLKFIEKYDFGGCLADDMGLGKTIQVLALLSTQPKDQQSLVVLPLSLVYNWIAEINKFAPNLTYFVHHGPKRNVGDWGTNQLILSTYDTIVKDIEKIHEKEFNYIILDESQAIKNPNSKRYKAMKLLTGRHKLVMTGTPIENNTFDLYSQMNFVNPGIFGSMAHFRNTFSKQIDVKGDVESAKKLQRIIKPFLVRRTKEQVATDLPEKTESIVYCEMDLEQRRIYDKYKGEIVSSLEKTIKDKGLNKSKILILDALLKLRQICIDPSILGHDAPSIKLDMIFEQLESIVGNHKVLIFSQFVTVLKLIEKRMQEKGIGYAYLDGKTKNRMDVVSDFQNNEEKRAFLISIKAGNVGLNLTAADYVFIVDPWWNPAVENQAIDRTHRIGQDKHVFSYKFICKNTIEEKIVKLQEKKKKISSDIIQADANFLRSFDKEGIMDLFG